MYLISKRFNFEAAHHLNGLPSAHPCSRHHGHSYAVILHLRCETLDVTGFVVDYRLLDGFKKWVDDTLDHQDLNNVFPGMNPTAENLARTIFNVAKPATANVAGQITLYAVTVKETEKTEARYEGDNA